MDKPLWPEDPPHVDMEVVMEPVSRVPHRPIKYDRVLGTQVGGSASRVTDHPYDQPAQARSPLPSPAKKARVAQSVQALTREAQAGGASPVPPRADPVPAIGGQRDRLNLQYLGEDLVEEPLRVALERPTDKAEPSEVCCETFCAIGSREVDDVLV